MELTRPRHLMLFLSPGMRLPILRYLSLRATSLRGGMLSHGAPDVPDYLITFLLSASYNE